jgi:glyoxylase-like metal-dependent hydrolase (beta-lactamase superfamily II)
MSAPVGHWGGGDVWRVTSGEFPSNAYICGLPADDGAAAAARCVIIDGGLDPQALDAQVIALGLTPTAMFCTHGHFDHAGSAAHFQKKYGCPVYLHNADRKLLKASNFLLMAFKLASRIEQPGEITAVTAGQQVDVAGHTLTFHGAPGHTPGSCLIELGSALFTGDTIYTRGVGLSHLPGEQPETLKQSILAAWPLLTEDRIVYPGHGRSASGAEVRTTNVALLDFLGMAQPEHTEMKAVEL